MADTNEGNGRPISVQNAPVQRVADRGQPEAFARVEAELPPSAPRRPFYKRPLVLLIGGVLIVAAIVVGVLWWLHARQFESTDDAFIAADVTLVSPRVAGHVEFVYVADNQHVEQGQKLLDLDPRDLQAKVDEAQAAVVAAQMGLQQAQSQSSSARADVGQAQAAEEAAQTEANRAHNELRRYESLSPQAVTQQQLINLRAAAASADAQLLAGKQKTVSAQAHVKSAQSQIEVAQAQVKQAEAALNAAALQRSYATVVAAISGYVTNRAVNVGDYLQPGQQVMALVPDDREHLYVMANYKETQLARMDSSQPADITVDAYPGHTFHGHVDSIQRGSGAAFSLLPPENATGNYVKVVQRVPVKIMFDSLEGYRLGPGMSVVPKVKVQ